MEHAQLYGRLRQSILSRRFAHNGSWRVNFPSSEGFITGVSSRQQFDALTQEEKLAGRWSSLQRIGENPWAPLGASLTVALAIESGLGHVAARTILGSLLQGMESQFRFSGEFAGYPIRWDPISTSADRWRFDAEGPMYCTLFPITSNRYDFANSPREFRRYPRRHPDTLRDLLGDYAPETPESLDALFEGDIDYHRRWEVSQDEIFGMLTALYAINQFSGDEQSQTKSGDLMRRIADYLSRNGYMLVKPQGGIVGRGSGDSLVGSEYALGRAFNTVLGSEFRSQLDWRGVMQRAGHWDQLAGPIAGFTFLGGLASLLSRILQFSSPSNMLFLVSSVFAKPHDAILSICPAISEAARDALLFGKLSRALAVIAHSDVFDPFREKYRNEHAYSMYLYEYDCAFRFRLYAEFCALSAADTPTPHFMAQTAMMALNDTDPMLRASLGQWLSVIRSPIGSAPRGLPKDSPLFTLGVACMMFGGDYEIQLRDALDAAKDRFENEFEADLELIEIINPESQLSEALIEKCGSAADYMAGLSLAWLYARRKFDASETLIDGFPVPPVDFSEIPRPLSQDGQDLFPNDQMVSRSPEPAVRVAPPPDTSLPPAIDKSITINESDHEVDTLITVHYGEIFRITATGSIQHERPWASNGPNGVPEVNHDARWPLHSGIDPSNTKWSLLARLNGWFEVGQDSGERRWLYDRLDDGGDAAKRLFLRINDNVAGDGGGAFQARIRVWGRSRLCFDALQAQDFGWILGVLPTPPSIRFAIRCAEPAGAARLTITVCTPNGELLPIIGESYGSPLPISQLLEGVIAEHAVVVNPQGVTTVFWNGNVFGGESLYGQNGQFDFHLRVTTAHGYFAEAQCSTQIIWHGKEISCIEKTRPPASQRILAVGGKMSDGREWKMSVGQVIREIDRGQQFWVERPVGDRVRVITAVTPGGRRFIKTEADGDAPNNLLALPHCVSQ